MSRKIIAISLILTIAVLGLTFNYWLIIKPITFSMDISSQDSDDITIITVLNRKNEPSFSKSYATISKINLKEDKKYSTSFDHKTSPKRLRFVFNGVTPNMEYQISNLAFKDGKYLINDLTRFKSDDATLIAKDSHLIIIPNDTSVTIDYLDKINVKPAIKCRLMIFLIIAILSYLLFYKLISYLPDFKIHKNTSRLDIAFLIVCAVLLIIPVCDINFNEISKKENRTLAKYIPLFDESKSINLNFSKDFESWISDRFGMRDILLDMYARFQNYMSSYYYTNRNAYWDKKTNWMFAKNRLNPEPLTQQQIDEISAALNGFNAFCKDNNIKLYVLISPRSENVYVQYTYLGKDYLDSYGDLIEKIRQNTKLPIIYPFNELIEASKKDYVFFKTDHHWTDFGAYIGYKTLIKEIKKDFPEIKEVDINDFNISQNNLARYEFDRKEYKEGSTYKALNIPDRYKKKILDTLYNYFTHKDYKLLKTDIIDTPALKAKYYKYPKGTNLKTLLIGSSVNENLTETIPYSFKDLHFIRINGPRNIPEEDEYKLIKIYGKNIINYKPDILIICIQAHTIYSLKDLINKD